MFDITQKKDNQILFFSLRLIIELICKQFNDVNFIVLKICLYYVIEALTSFEFNGVKAVIAFRVALLILSTKKQKKKKKEKKMKKKKEK